MGNLSHIGIKALHNPWITRASVLPAPTLLVVSLLLLAFGSHHSLECFHLMAANTLLGYTIVNIVAAAVIARSFIKHETPVLLMMGCGVVIWSCSGLMATLGGLKLLNETVNVNQMITAHNCCIWVSSFCHLAGVSLSLNWRVSPKRPGIVVAAAYALAVATAGAIVLATVCGWLPIFFIPGHGGTLVRQFMLSSTVGMLALAAFILLYLNRPASGYLHWYPHALILLAVGVTAILMQKVNGGWIGWIGRGAQSLGGFYMLAAAVLYLERQLSEGTQFWQALNEMRQKWALSTAIAVIVVSLGAAARLLFLPYLGFSFPFITFYPAVFLAAAYGGLGPGLAATGLSVAMAYWLRLATDVPYDESVLLIHTSFFTLFGISISWGWKFIHRLQKRTIMAETDAAYASERALAAETLRETLSKLQQSEESFTTFVNTANEGVWIMAADGTTSYINKRLAKILGREKCDVIGRGAHEFVYPEDRPLFRQQLEILRKGEVSTYELRIPHAEREVTWLQVSSAPLFDVDNGVRGSFAMCTDITRLKETEEELLRLNLQLEQMVFERSSELRRLNRELESFCYSISHELRAPIARLLAFSNLVKEAAAEENLEELPYLSERIGVAGAKMRVVIDSLLMINRLSRAELQKECFDISEAVGLIAADIGEEIPGLRVQLRIEKGLIATCDRAMLNICLRNLIENAFKYSGKKEIITVDFGLDRISGAYFVRDSGTGFDTNFSQELFEPFSRLHRDQDFEGSGMGLTIVKRIIERHGGRVWAEGRPGEGATFFFTLAEEGCGDWYGLTGGRHEQAVAVAC